MNVKLAPWLLCPCGIQHFTSAADAPDKEAELAFTDIRPLWPSGEKGKSSLRRAKITEAKSAQGHVDDNWSGARNTHRWMRIHRMDSVSQTQQLSVRNANISSLQHESVTWPWGENITGNEGWGTGCDPGSHLCPHVSLQTAAADKAKWLGVNFPSFAALFGRIWLDWDVSQGRE